MITPQNAIVLVPARMASTRLPGKPLADIAGVPMIVHVWRRAIEANVGPVLVACAEQEIIDAVTRAGGQAVATAPDHPSGSDRIFEALQHVDENGRYGIVVNLQGDLPTLDPALVKAALTPLADPDVDIATLVAPIDDPEECSDPNVVKAAVSFADGAAIGRALYFSRSRVPWGDGPIWHHIGLYAYRRAALTRFVRLPCGVLERRERLEQLRALEHGMRIDVARVETVPLGVDTEADLARARALLTGR
jgi:3-deoxy-manno-octulosonate cytidylyltransferase (CMP-KDO synthetase)